MMGLKQIGLWLTAGLVLGGGILAIAALTPRQWGTTSTKKKCEFTIYVLGDTMHTNLLLPVENGAFDWGRVLPLSSLGHKETAPFRYLEFGWGDRRWYIETPSWEQMDKRDILRVLFFPGNTSALYVRGHTDLPNYPAIKRACLQLSREDYLALVRFVKNSFDLDYQGQPQKLTQQRRGDSGFYAARGYYSILRTCNSWTAEGLQTANVNTPLWNGLAPAVMHQLRNNCECPPP